MKRQVTAIAVLALLLCSTFSRLNRAQEAGGTAAKANHLNGLHGQVLVRRDARGIPYIEAANNEDLYFAQGYVTASDRLWQMDLLRRVVRGQLCEIFGSTQLAQDQLHRTFGFAKLIDDAAANLPPTAKTALESYAKGVNAYIASRDDKNLPPEFGILQYKPRPWTPADSLAVGKLMFEYLSNTWRIDVMRAAMASLPKEKRDALMPEITALDVLAVGSDRGPKKAHAQPELPESLRPDAQMLAKLAQLNEEQTTLARLGFPIATDDSFQASNNWVVSGKRTASGKPLLANDPHLQPAAPGLWYLTELTAPGIHVAGVTFPGAPGITLGHNEHIAWGATNLGPDVQDLYAETFDKEDPKRYLTPAGWRDAEIRHEEIKVRKSFTDPATDTQIYDVTVTRHGPIILAKDGVRYALRWPALDPGSNEFVGLFEANRASNWQEFTTALSHYAGPTQNLVYADTLGHIGYYGAGRIPIRKSGDGSLPYDGSTDDGEWVGWIPFDKLPHVYDPPSGMIVTANQRIAGTDYPFFLTHYWAQPYRAHRIADLLSKTPKLTSDDFRRIQGDVYSEAGVVFARAAAKTLKNQPGNDDKLNSDLAQFENWDGRLNADARTAPLVAQMRVAFRQRVLTAAMGPDLVKTFAWPVNEVFIDRVASEQPPQWLPKEFPTYVDLFRACYNEARQTLTRTLGDDESNWLWGNMVKTNFNHPLASIPFVGNQFAIAPMPQNGTTFQLGASVNVGAPVSMRMIADPSAWDKTLLGIPLGQSGLPTSPHWKDQLDDWRNVTPRALPFSKEAVAAATKEMLLLEP